MPLGGLVEVSPSLEDPVLRTLLDAAYRACAARPMGLALPWAFRERANALLDPSVRRLGIQVHGLRFVDVDGREALELAEWTPLVIACSPGFRSRLERRGIVPLSPGEGLRSLEAGFCRDREPLDSPRVSPTVDYELMSSG
jgi:hypothetical protein